MPDPRFFEDLGPASLSELAALTGATLSDPTWAERRVRTLAPLAQADEQAIAFFSDRRYSAAFGATAAGACFVAPAHVDHAPASCAVLVTAQPQAAYAQAGARLHSLRTHPSDAPARHPDAEIEDDVHLAPGVVVGPGARIGRGTRVGANTVVGPGVCIGRDGLIGANVSIGFALIGDRVRILAGAVIGEAGFGVAGAAGGAIDVPQLGRVIVQDNVTIGANSCIDRGAWADTVIGENTKIDNLVQIGHNVRLGRNCVLAAHTGISGSVTAGDGVAFGGRAGIADHLHIGDGAQIAAAAGLMKDVPAGETWGGFPARPIRQWLKETAWVARGANTKARGGDKS